MKNNKLLACPYIVWMILFTIIPLGIVFYYALTDSITGQFTLANLAGMGTYLPIFLRSIWLSLFASLICLVIGYPVAYFIAQCKPLTQRFLEMLIMLPMCMSFLLRTLAWVGMLEDTGIHQYHPAAARHRPAAAHPHERRCHPRHGVQLPAVYDPAALFRHHEDRQPPDRGRA